VVVARQQTSNKQKVPKYTVKIFFIVVLEISLGGGIRKFLVLAGF